MNKRMVGLVLIGLFIQAPVFAAEDQWEYALSPYLWFAGIKGDVATVPPLPAAPIEVTPSQAMEDTQAALMILFTAKKNRHGVFFDFLYTDVESDEELVPAPISLTMKSISKTTLVTLAYQYEVHRNDRQIVDVLAGLRYWDIDTTLKFGGGLGIVIPPGTELNHTESWTDPAIGITGTAFLGDSKFYFNGAAGIGGFGVGSDLFYDINANVGYQWNKAIGTAIGYRLFDVDYEKDNFRYDVTQQGWLIGLTWSF
ncbi:hypothetical protein [Kaarinaea lacus]